MATAPLCVVLVEPAGPLNVGSVARLCANFEVDDLRLVVQAREVSAQSNDAGRVLLYRRHLGLGRELADVTGFTAWRRASVKNAVAILGRE